MVKCKKLNNFINVIDTTKGRIATGILSLLAVASFASISSINFFEMMFYFTLIAITTISWINMVRNHKWTIFIVCSGVAAFISSAIFPELPYCVFGLTIITQLGFYQYSKVFEDK